MKKEPSNVEAGPKEGLQTAMGKWGTHIYSHPHYL